MRIGEEKQLLKCKNCNGEGFILTKKGGTKTCDICQGTGKLNWMENIFGKNYNTR